MAFLVLLAEMGIGQVSIDLRGGYTGVAQQFLNMAQRSPILEQMGGKTMAQGVRRNSFIHTSLLTVGLQDVPDPLASKTLPTVVDEKGQFVLVASQQ